MDTRSYISTPSPPVPDLFSPHPNLSDEINHNIVQSEVDGGVYLDHLPDGAALEVETLNRFYTIVNQGQGHALISGHPKFCPSPVRVKIHGSNWGGSMLKVRYIGRGMHLEFRHPEYRTIITSRIVEIRPVDLAAIPSSDSAMTFTSSGSA